MALIVLKGRKEPIEIDNAKAVRIKDDWVNKTPSSTIVDLGHLTFSFGQIKSIELTRERKSTFQEDYNRPLTSEERKHKIEMMKRVRKNLEEKGILQPQKDDKSIGSLMEKAENY